MGYSPLGCKELAMTDNWWEALAQNREYSLVLCEDLDRWDGGCGREA